MAKWRVHHPSRGDAQRGPSYKRGGCYLLQLGPPRGGPFRFPDVANCCFGQLTVPGERYHGDVAQDEGGHKTMPASRHILLVDDDPIFLASMADALRFSGYRVTTAEHFSTALNTVEGAEKPDVLVTDLVMPRSVNGLALGRMVRLRHPRVATVFLTGYNVPALEQEAFGPELRKPVEPAQLIAAIEAECARRAEETAPLTSPPV
jgi:CheY-like chemotaxis protein